MSVKPVRFVGGANAPAGEVTNYAPEYQLSPVPAGSLSRSAPAHILPDHQ
jgi:hypothetical protein